MKTGKNKIKIQVEGMSCANCAVGIKKHLEAKGLENVNVNFSTGEANCNVDNNQSAKEVVKIIKELGYTVITKNKKDYIGKLATIKFFQYTPDAVPRFPYAIGFRDYE